MKIKNKNGYIALMSVVLMSGILLAIGVTMAHQSISNTLSVFDWVESQKAKQTAEACGEYAFGNLFGNMNYTGNEIINIGDESCQIEAITGFGNINRGVKTVSTIDNIYTKRWSANTGTIYNGTLVTQPQVNFFKEVAN